MKCHPKYLTSKIVPPQDFSICEMVNASRHTFVLLSGPLQRFSKTRRRSEEANISHELIWFAGGTIHYDFWPAFFPATYPATAPATAPTMAAVRTTPHGQTGHANNPT
jgi:hypothetical protein